MMGDEEPNVIYMASKTNVLLVLFFESLVHVYVVKTISLMNLSMLISGRRLFLWKITYLLWCLIIVDFIAFRKANTIKIYLLVDLLKIAKKSPRYAGHLLDCILWMK